MVGDQRGAELVVLPELWVQGGFAFGTFAATAEPLDGPLVRRLGDAARDLGAWLHGGSVVERAADGRLFNTSVLLGPDGTLAATYRKIHLFGFSAGETSVLSAGTDVVTTDVDGTTGGLATCYDLRFPELFRAFVDRGAELVLLPSAWPTPRIAHWSLLTRARAVEDQAYVVAVNGCGDQGGSLALGGRSVVVDPWGTRARRGRRPRGGARRRPRPRAGRQGAGRLPGARGPPARSRRAVDRRTVRRQ